jgi:cytochrome P450
MDTTGSLIEVIIYQLAEHPEYQDIILESLKSEPNIYTNKKLNNFILETMRLLSPLRYSMAREVVKPFAIGGFKFELGDKFRLCYGAVMTNMKYFDNPWEFKPDRFNNPLQHPNSFMPFSGGARNCIGQHMAMMELRVATT